MVAIVDVATNPYGHAPATPKEVMPNVSARQDGNVGKAACSTASAPPATGTGTPQEDGERIAWLLDQAIANEKRETARKQIEIYFSHRGSPMQGTGAIFVREGERTGIPPALSVGIAAAESTDGKRTYNSYTDACPGESFNAWGMINSRFYGGFGSWENGIIANFDWLIEWHSQGGPPQSIYDCGGYCVGGTTNRTVDDVQRYVEGVVP